jgi:hypothetical protein
VSVCARVVGRDLTRIRARGSRRAGEKLRQAPCPSGQPGA